MWHLLSIYILCGIILTIKFNEIKDDIWYKCQPILSPNNSAAWENFVGGLLLFALPCFLYSFQNVFLIFRNGYSKKKCISECYYILGWTFQKEKGSAGNNIGIWAQITVSSPEAFFAFASYPNPICYLTIQNELIWKVNNCKEYGIGLINRSVCEFWRTPMLCVFWNTICLA